MNFISLQGVPHKHILTRPSGTRTLSFLLGAGGNYMARVVKESR
uniref:Uncharacterized protein n=1 Tax=Arundo donax TaxID=35708 RepID=A0A0A9H0U1_ARUDO